MKSKKQKNYTKSFKEEAVKLVIEQVIFNQAVMFWIDRGVTAARF